MSAVKFHDLANSEKKAQALSCEICIIGAGAAGIYLATRLASQGRNVIVLEAGDKTVTEVTRMNFEPNFTRDVYPGALTGRFFGLGGSTTRWGGLLIPHSKHDIRSIPARDLTSWQHIVDVVTANSAKVLKQLDYAAEGFQPEYAKCSIQHRHAMLQTYGIETASGLFLPFQKRNLAYLFKKKCAAQAELNVYYHAVVYHWKITEHAKKASIQAISARSDTGNTLIVTAKRFILAAGAIESARLLLELNQVSTTAPVIREHAAIGCYLSDHLSLAIADVPPKARRLAIKQFAPYFEKGWMRSFRFLDAAPLISAPRAFFHFIFDNKSAGFFLLKELFASLQKRELPRIPFSQFCMGSMSVARFAYTRFVRSALYLPSDTPIHLQMDIEQFPSQNNTVTLGKNFDCYGRRRAAISWSTTDQDLEKIVTTARRFLGKWPVAHPLIPTLISRLNTNSTIEPKDAYHPTGTCRMGEDIEAVVDYNLKVWGVNNLWVVSTGVLPSAGTANPTFTMLCLAEFLVGEWVTNE